MHHRALTPLEQQWSDEVRYLHSLWHQSTHSILNPKPLPTPTPTPKLKLLSPVNTISFKKENNKNKTKKKKIASTEDPNTPPVSNFAWQCEPSPPPRSKIGWPVLVSKPESITLSVSAEDQAKLAATQLQQKGLKACQELFSRNLDSDDSEDDDDDDDEDEESEKSEFFLRIFKEDKELRNYYEKNFEAGDFCCLVCGGIGEKVGKRFKNCVALVQHSIAISKTKSMSAHRAFGQAICQLLGWNITRLPSIVLSLDASLGQISGNNNNAEELLGVNDNGVDDENEIIPKKVVEVCGLNEVDANQLH